MKESIKNNGGSITRDNYEIWKADLELLSQYASADTDLTLRVYNHFIKALESEGLEKFFFEDEVMPLYKEVTIPMEQVGIKLDMELIKTSRTNIIEKLKEYGSAPYSVEDIESLGDALNDLYQEDCRTAEAYVDVTVTRTGIDPKEFSKFIEYLL